MLRMSDYYSALLRNVPGADFETDNPFNEA
jgi:hypothetical protein